MKLSMREYFWVKQREIQPNSRINNEQNYAEKIKRKILI
jgi:hypothetical protein